MILAGDIGGTNCRLAVFHDDGATLVRQQVFKNAGRATFEEIASEFLAGEKIDRACFGVAGAVRGGVVPMTNLGWRLDENKLQRELKIGRVRLINDMVAHAENVEHLVDNQVQIIREGEAVSDGGGAVIIAGTGLGEGGLYFDRVSGRRHGFASEGGHCDFSPRDAREVALMQYVKQRGKPASWESVLSGPGLRLVYDFVREVENVRGQDFGDAGPTPEQISRVAAQRTCELCTTTADLFISLYGAEAGNLALKCCATAGVWVGGSIAGILIDSMRSKVFVDAFGAKGAGRIREMLARIPIRLIRFDLSGLHGAARMAREG